MEALGCQLLAYNRNYSAQLIVVVCLTRFGSTANLQMLTLAREYVDRSGKEAVMFGAILQAQIALAWMIFTMTLG